MEDMADQPKGKQRDRVERGDKKALQRMQKCLAESNFYEALQLIKMLTCRHISRKRYSDAETTLVSGMETLLAHNQRTATSELGQQLIKLYVETRKLPTDAIIETIIRLFHAYGPEDVDDGRVSFLKAAIRWTMAGQQDKNGDPRLHEVLADYYTSKHLYGSAQQHFARANNQSKFATMLVDYARGGNDNEADLFITRAVLMCLCLKKQEAAKELLEHYLSRCSSLKNTPLINFLHLLLDSFTRNNAKDLFVLLNKHYSPSLSRDPELFQYLNQIGSLYFNLQPQSTSGFGIFNELFKAFLSPEGEAAPSS